jgi:arylsulfatase A-like enzyme
MARPNIVLIHSDQHRYDCVRSHGHPLVRTPNLDRLAEEGVDYTHAFCPIPLCVPARASLLCGQWPTSHLNIANFDTEAPRPMRDDVPTFSQLMRDAGYRLGYIGKWHVHQRKDPRDYGFHDYVPEDDYVHWRKGLGVPPRPRVNRWFGEVDPDVLPSQSRLAWGADQTIRRIECYERENVPFFIRWDPSEPHLPNVVPEPFHSMCPPGDVPPWPSFPDPLEGKPYIQAQQRRTWKLDSWTWDDWRPLVSRYLGEISLLDEQVGRILGCLDQLGLARNTLFVYTTDHGDMCGGHGMIDKHFIMYDDVMHVPLSLRWPGTLPAGVRCDSFILSALDLASTFLEVAGLDIPATFQGQSLLPLLSGGGTRGREDVFGMYHGNQFGLYSQRMVRNRRWKYIWNATAEDELYDLEADPGEVRNRALAPECAEVLASLRKRLVAWMEQAGDRLLNPWTRAQILEGLTK